MTGIDPTTYNGDEVTLEIYYGGPYTGYIAYNGGAGDAYYWYSYLKIPPKVTNKPPTACFTVLPASGNTSTIFSVDGSCSSDPEDPTSSLKVRWDWENDGIYDTSYTTTKTSTHKYLSKGNYTIKMQVKDTGGLTDTTTLKVTVE
ncbi:MAG: PKD domain-containing protein, partial [Methanosarcinales archaeon]